LFKCYNKVTRTHAHTYTHARADMHIQACTHMHTHKIRTSIHLSGSPLTNELAQLQPVTTSPQDASNKILHLSQEIDSFTTCGFTTYGLRHVVTACGLQQLTTGAALTHTHKQAHSVPWHFMPGCSVNASKQKHAHTHTYAHKHLRKTCHGISCLGHLQKANNSNSCLSAART